MDSSAPGGPGDTTSTTATVQVATRPDVRTVLPTSTTQMLTTSISTSFAPGQQIDGVLPSLTLLSSDSVHFYVHGHVLKKVSNNGFDGLLNQALSDDPDESANSDRDTSTPIMAIPMHSDPLNVVLHAAYGISCAQFAPSLDALIDAVDSLPKYGVSPAGCIFGPSDRSSDASPLYSLLLSLAPAHPLPVYALAAHHSLDDLAIASSQHLLSTPSYEVSDEAALRMGPVYTKRLLFLLLGRVEALKTLVSSPPPPHAPTPLCGTDEQIKLAQAWTSAAGSLLWGAQPDLPVSSIEASLRPSGNTIHCHVCQRSSSDRIHEVITQWPNVKRTI